MSGAWLTGGSVGTGGEITGLTPSRSVRGAYFAERTDPFDPDKTQVQLHLTRDKEYSGLSEATAISLQGAFVSAAKKVTRTMEPIGGGGYSIIESVDEIGGNWITLAQI